MEKIRIYSRKTLREFWERPGREDAKGQLESWYKRTQNAWWQGPQDVKADYGSASILKNGRVVFNIAGNKYRLVVRINYRAQKVFVRFIGTHKEYDAINADTV